jgi:hypothetical protein
LFACGIRRRRHDPLRELLRVSTCAVAFETRAQSGDSHERAIFFCAHAARESVAKRCGYELQKRRAAPVVNVHSRLSGMPPPMPVIFARYFVIGSKAASPYMNAALTR